MTKITSRVSIVVLVALGMAAGADYWLRADDRDVKAEKKQPAARPAGAPLRAPAHWPAGHPLPQVASNCARCHLTAGRELTAAVHDFAHSVHDLNELSCNDCHGGNTQDDVKAHEEDFAFIGTKLSAHIQHCSECHSEQAEELASGPHHWDFSKRINPKYPTCIDCHGNHDIGNPPSDFKLADVCGDCHRDVQKKFPNLASVVAAEDRLWQTIDRIRDEKLGNTTQRVPPEFQQEVDDTRHHAMLAMHRSRELSPQDAKNLAGRLDGLQAKLTEWLKTAK